MRTGRLGWSLAGGALLCSATVQRAGLGDLNNWTNKLAAAGALVLLTRAVRRRRQDSVLGGHLVLLASLSLLAALPSHLLGGRAGMPNPHLRAWTVSTLFLVYLLHVQDRGAYRNMVRMVVGVAVLVCGFGFLQYVTVRGRLLSLAWTLPPEMRLHFLEESSPVAAEGLRIPSVFFHSNEFGHFLVIVFGILAPFSVRAAPRMAQRVAYGGLLLAVLTSTLLTQSRTAVALIGVEAGIALLYLRPRLPAVRWTLPAFALVAGGLCWLFSRNAVAFVRRMASGSLSFRDRIWQDAASLIPENLALGIGPGRASFEMLQRFPATDPGGMEGRLSVGYYDYWGSHAHNDLLTSLIEVGALGTFLRYLLCIVALRGALRLFRSPLANLQEAAVCGGLCVLVAELLRSTVESYSFLASPACGALFALVLASLCFADGNGVMSGTPGRQRHSVSAPSGDHGSDGTDQDPDVC